LGSFGFLQKHIFWSFRLKKGLDMSLTLQIQFCMGSGDEVGGPFGMQAAIYGGPNEAAMTSYVYLRVPLHFVIGYLLTVIRFFLPRKVIYITV